MEDQLGQWFHPALEFEDDKRLISLVADATDLNLRRKYSKIGHQFQDVSSKLQNARYHAGIAIERVDFARQKLPQMLADLAGEAKSFKDGFWTYAKKVNVASEFRDPILTANIEAALIQARSALESLTQLYAFAFDRSIKTFSDSGKKVIRDLNNLGSTRAVEAIEMKSLLERARVEWIVEAIKYRDQIIHFGQLGDFRCQTIKFNKGMKFSVDEVAPARMPSGVQAEVYLHRLIEQLHEFSSDWLKIIFRELQNKETQGRLKLPTGIYGPMPPPAVTFLHISYRENKIDAELKSDELSAIVRSWTDGLRNLDPEQAKGETRKFVLKQMVTSPSEEDRRRAAMAVLWLLFVGKDMDLIEHRAKAHPYRIICEITDMPDGRGVNFRVSSSLVDDVVG